MSFVIRHAEAGDLPGIVDIYNQSIPGRLATADTAPVTVAQRQDWFDAHHRSRPLLVSQHEKSGVLAGWCSVRDFYGRPAYSNTVEIAVYVANASQGQGVAKQLLKAMHQQLLQVGVTSIAAFIFSHNLASIQLFEKHGYDHWGELPQIAHMDGEQFSLTILGKKL